MALQLNNGKKEYASSLKAMHPRTFGPRFFWKALPDCGFAQKGTSCHGQKRERQWLCLSMLLVKRKPQLWYESQPNQRASRQLTLPIYVPVTYFNQPKVWMTEDIFISVLTKFNRKLLSKGRNIVLLMDNDGCHPEGVVKDQFNNIKVVFLPPNTMSKLQHHCAKEIRNVLF